MDTLATRQDRDTELAAVRALQVCRHVVTHANSPQNEWHGCWHGGLNAAVQRHAAHARALALTARAAPQLGPSVVTVVQTFGSPLDAMGGLRFST